MKVLHLVCSFCSKKMQSNQKLTALIEELNAILLYLEEMRKKKVERWDQFAHVIGQIKKVASEIRLADFVPFKVPVDQSDLSLRKLVDLTKELQSLQKEKVSNTHANLIHLDQCIFLTMLCGLLLLLMLYEASEMRT
jgi:Ase1/PRC1/MAP65 family protein